MAQEPFARNLKVATTPFDDQRPGTAGLRKTVEHFRQPHYLENFIQSIFDTVEGLRGATLVLGGDGRYWSQEAIVTIIAMAAANGIGQVLVGRDGLFTTPAASAIIRRRGAAGGILLTASHNPGGPEGDFGVKYNVANGGPAPEQVTEAIHRRSQEIDAYWTLEAPPAIDLGCEGSIRCGGMEVQVIDPVADYQRLMEELFDFDALRRLLSGDSFRMRFDAMHAATGPYAHALFEGALGAPPGTVIHGEPLPDFGGYHPDPNPIHARDLVEALQGSEAPDFGAASDGDGDRNMVLGRNFFVHPADSLAVIAAHLEEIPSYRGRLKGVARSMPTPRAVDRVAEARGLACFETPTGWKYFGNLLDAGWITLCGEESFGTGSDHVREKDGLWAVLCWLSILAQRRESVESIIRDHWARYGRTYASRHDYEDLPIGAAEQMIEELRQRLPHLPGTRVAGATVQAADEFTYTDPIDGSVSIHQGIRVELTGGDRIVYRLSGTGTHGATLRLYLEHWEGSSDRHSQAVQRVLEPLAQAAQEIARVAELTGRTEPSLRI